MHPTDLASNVLKSLFVDPRLSDGELILIGHSLGGLVIKLMLRKAQAVKNRRAEAASFIDRVRKVAFLSTPHSGADLAQVANVLRVLVRPSAATMSLVRNDAYLRDLNEGYKNLASDRKINHLILTERQPLIIRRKALGLTYFRKDLGVIVKPDSGDPGLVTNPVPIPADHIEIAKPANRESDVYKFVRDFIERRTEPPPDSREVIKIDAVQKAQGEESARAEARHTEATEGQKRLERLMIDAAAGGAPAVQAVVEIRDLLRPGNPEIDTIEAEKLPALLKRILEDLKKPAAWPEEFSGTVKRVLEEARAQAANLKFADAAQMLDAALAQTEAEDRDRARGRAALLAERGRMAWLQWRYREAADYYAEAALTMEFDPAAAWRHTMDRADALYAQGDEFGDNQALQDAIRVYHSILESVSRDSVPLQWATTQNNLGSALVSLGERESGTARLEEAVAAFRDALQQGTRTRAPLLWAATQMNLGSALLTLGERESGTARLEEGVAAYREALQENTRARAPLEWAKNQVCLGNALSTLGEREGGTARLEEAVSAYRGALEENTRERVPLEWAMTQMNLGTALATLGVREGGTARLEEAVAAYRDALQERIRARVPLKWAMTQMNLGTALFLLGERQSGTARLEEAVSAYRESLQENTRARVPPDWAMY